MIRSDVSFWCFVLMIRYECSFWCFVLMFRSSLVCTCTRASPSGGPVFTPSGSRTLCSALCKYTRSGSFRLTDRVWGTGHKLRRSGTVVGQQLCCMISLPVKTCLAENVLGNVVSIGWRTTGVIRDICLTRMSVGSIPGEERIRIHRQSFSRHSH